MKHKLIERIVELVGSFTEPFQEYYSHTKANMWKWRYTLTKYGGETWNLCKVGDDEEESYVQALKALIDILEEKKKNGILIIDKVRPIRETMQPTIKRFFDNLYVANKSIALWSYYHLSSGKYTIDEVLNMTSSKLIEQKISVSMKEQNMFAIPF